MSIILTAPVIPFSDIFKTTVLSLSPKIYYRFEDDQGASPELADSSGNGHHGNYNGDASITFGAETIIPSALRSSRSVILPGGAATVNGQNVNSTLWNVGNNFTMGMAFLVTHTDAVKFFRRDYTSTTNRQFSMEGASTNMNFRLVNTSSTAWVDHNYTGITPRDGQPHLAIGVYSLSEGRWEVWFDNTVKSRSTIGNIRQPTTGRVGFGQGVGFTNNSMNGNMDDYFFYDRALSVAEIGDLYTAFNAPV